jgi:hypothetical protein
MKDRPRSSKTPLAQHARVVPGQPRPGGSLAFLVLRCKTVVGTRLLRVPAGMRWNPPGWGSHSAPSGVCWPPDARDPWAKRRRATVTGIEARRSPGHPKRNEAVVLVDKAEIIALLLSRGNEVRASWVDRVLPELVDTDANASLLKLLDVDLSTMSDATEQRTEHGT